MKKTYIAPATEELNILSEGMIAASLIVDGDNTVDTSDPTIQLGNGRRGEWGNLWK